MSTPWQALRTWARMVKFSHSVFALPFALSGAVLAAANHGISGRQVGWIVVAMFGARNAAMGFNRLVDHAFDAVDGCHGVAALEDHLNRPAASARVSVEVSSNVISFGAAGLRPYT